MRYGVGHLSFESIFARLGVRTLIDAARPLPNAGWRLISRRATHNNANGVGNVRFRAIAGCFAAVAAALLSSSRMRLLSDRRDAGQSGAPQLPCRWRSRARAERGQCASGKGATGRAQDAYRRPPPLSAAGPRGGDDEKPRWRTAATMEPAIVACG